MRPKWGAFYGPYAVSEQSLLESAIDRLPSGSTVIADASFGVFSVVHAPVCWFSVKWKADALR